MSIQEDKLKGIADAIRYKEGSVSPIVANDFATRIRNLPSSEGGCGLQVLSGWGIDKISALVHAVDYSEFSATITIEVLEGY